MKITSLSITLLLLVSFSNFGQTRSMRHFDFSQKDLFKVKIRFIDKDKPAVKAVLFKTTDSTIIVTRSVDETDYIYEKAPIEIYSIKEIETLSIWRNRKIINTALKSGGYAAGGFGGLTFLVFALGSNSEEVGSPFFYAITGGLMGFIPGFITGALIGSSREHIVIDGSEATYNNQRTLINNYAFVKERRKRLPKQ